MNTYAEIYNGTVSRILEAEEAPQASGAFLYVDVTGDPPPCGFAFDYLTRTFSAPVPVIETKPVIVLTNITFSGPGSDYAQVRGNEITITEGVTIHVAGELQLHGEKAPVTAGPFRMPIKRSDGTEPELAFAMISDGDVGVSWKPAGRGIFSVTEELLNRELPEAQHMKFSGFRAFVVGATS